MLILKDLKDLKIKNFFLKKKLLTYVNNIQVVILLYLNNQLFIKNFIF